MEIGSAAMRAQSGAVSTVLIGLAGFVAGVLVVGLLELVRVSEPVAGQTSRVPVSNAGGHDAVAAPMMIEPGRPWPSQAEPFPWPFESATPASQREPGKKRPDRLSGPEGWTPDPPPGP